MRQPPLEICEITQVDNFRFGITWSDDVRHVYRLSDLQKQCPCAQCNVDGRRVEENVKAVTIKSIGRYAMKIHYTSGCSKGIYTYAMLRQFPKECT